MLESREARAIACPNCGTQVAAHFLICPGCHRLVHAETLKRLAEEAGTAEAAGQWSTALVAWRSAMELLPPGSKQYGAISAKVADLGKKVDASPGPKPTTSGGKPGWAGGAAGLGTFALMVLGKGKDPAPWADQGEHSALDVRDGGGVLVALGLAFRDRAGGHDLHP